MTVVSEMGEIWSPQTAPARHAEMPIFMSTGSEEAKMAVTMGMRMPKVPQLVPVEKARKTATRKIMAGSMEKRLSAAPPTTPATNTSAPRAPVMDLRVSAKVRMSRAGTMAMKPLVMQSMASLNVTTRRAMR